MIARLQEQYNKEVKPGLVERFKYANVMAVPRLKKIVTIVGPRRAGKTYFLYQIMKEILQGSAGITASGEEKSHYVPKRKRNHRLP